MMATTGSAAEWYPDPTGRHQFRYFDGDVWTENVSDAGVATTDSDPILVPVEELKLEVPRAGSPGGSATLYFTNKRMVAELSMTSSHRSNVYLLGGVVGTVIAEKRAAKRKEVAPEVTVAQLDELIAEKKKGTFEVIYSDLVSVRMERGWGMQHKLGRMKVQGRKSLTFTFDVEHYDTILSILQAAIPEKVTEKV